MLICRAQKKYIYIYIRRQGLKKLYLKYTYIFMYINVHIYICIYISMPYGKRCHWYCPTVGVYSCGLFNSPHTIFHRRVDSQLYKVWL